MLASDGYTGLMIASNKQTKVYLYNKVGIRRLLHWRTNVWFEVWKVEVFRFLKVMRRVLIFENHLW